MTAAQKIDAILSAQGIIFENEWLRSKDANLRLVWLRSLLGNYAIPAMPPHVQICSSYRCNYRCRFCGGHGVDEERHGKLNTQTAMTDERLFSILREVLPYAYTWTVAASGEFFCQSGIADILRFAAMYKSRASVTTNGSLMHPEILSRFLSSACSLRVSMVSGIKEAYEYFHRNGDFANVVSNIRMLTRANEMLTPERRIGVGMVGPILTSTVRELPHRVMVARALKMDMIASTSFLLQSRILSQQDKRWDNERCDRFPGLWNFYRLEAGRMALRDGVSDKLHRTFDGVKADPVLPIPEDRLMFPSIPDFVETAPPTETHFRNDIESAARMIADNVIKAHGTDEKCEANGEIQARPVEILRNTLSKYRDNIIQLAESDETIRVCWRLDLNANILPGDAWRPCCVSPARFSFPPSASISDRYNSEKMIAFRGELARGSIPDGCRGCRDLAVITTRRLADEIFKTGKIDATEMYESADLFTNK